MKEGNEKMNTVGSDDPRFTAKALGEQNESLDGIEIDESSMAEFVELKHFADEVKESLGESSENDALGASRIEAIRKSTKERKRSNPIRFPIWGSGLAACLIVGFVMFKSDDQSPLVYREEIAKNDESRLGAGATVEERGESPVSVVEAPLQRKPAESDGLEKRFDQLSVPAIGVAEEGDERAASLLEKNANAALDLDSNLSAIKQIQPDEIQDNRSQPLLGEDAFVLQPFEVNSDPVAADEASEEANRLSLSARRGNDVALGTNRMRLEGASGLRNILPVPPPEQRPPAPREEWNREAYAFLEENEFRSATDHPLSTFSIDVDTASYANARRALNSGSLPPAAAIRIEELVNYFNYDYAAPTDDRPFASHLAVASAPWNPNNRLVRIALKGKEVSADERPAANLVFLVDVSGSMSSDNKLGLVKRSLRMLVEQMEERDRIAIAVYAGSSGVALPSTTANNRETILHALERLQAGGSTNGAAGIELAYGIARRHFVEGGINRVILCTDGDFNVGATSEGSLAGIIEEKAKTGVFFSAIGFGMGNYQDDRMETLSNRGNGNYAYIDSDREARKVFVDQMLGTLHAIAKDVKIQVEFNPAQVSAYRLIGYENRVLAKEDFNNDAKDAGEIGAGHTVTALYEIAPPGQEVNTPSVDPLRYQTQSDRVTRGNVSEELLTAKLRYKEPDGDTSKLLEYPLVDDGATFESADADLRFASAVALYGMILSGSSHFGQADLADAIRIARGSLGSDEEGLRKEFVALAEKAKALRQRNPIR